MEIEVETTEQNHVDFYKEFGLRNWIIKTLLLLLIDIIVCIFLNALLWPLLFILGTLLFPFFFIIPYYTSRAKFKQAYERNLSPLSKKIYKPFGAGIEVTDDSGNFFLRYENIKKAGKTRNYVYLILPTGDYYLLTNWSFSSYHEIDHFLRVVTNGIANAKGVRPRAPLTFKPVYLVGILCLIPMIGAFAGIVLIILGLVHYKDRIFVIIGSVGVLITIAVYSSVFYVATKSDFASKGFVQLSQIQLNDLVKSVEFYKLQHGSYPDSLQQLDTKGSFENIYDPVQSFKNNKVSATYQYHKIGDKYTLFSAGVDGIPGTKDDIYPVIAISDSTKLGFIREK